MPEEFPPRLEDKFYLTEGGTETEVMYKWGYDLPEFAMFPLLDNPEAHATITDIFRRYMDAAEENGTGILLNAHDYRASPDWAHKLGYDDDQLAEFERRTIEFLRGIRAEYEGRVSDVYIGGAVGPRGDAYGTGGNITEDEARNYHSAQLRNLRNSGADFATALTFNNIDEAVGAIRAAVDIGIPMGLSFNIGPNGKLRSGPSLREAIEETDRRSDGAAAFFGTNCAHPNEFGPALEDEGDWLDRLRYIRPNAAETDKLALCKLGHLEDGDPVELGQQMGEIARRLPQVDIISGCCGTDERHLGEIAKNVNRVRGYRGS